MGGLKKKNPLKETKEFHFPAFILTALFQMLVPHIRVINETRYLKKKCKKFLEGKLFQKGVSIEESLKRSEAKSFKL